MTHNVLFVLTHTGAEIAPLKEAIYAVKPNIHLFCTGTQYQSYDDLQYLRSLPHHIRNAASVWGDVIYDNAGLSRFLLPYVDIIAYFSTTKACETVLNHSFGKRAEDYYINRLVGIRQFVERKKGIVISEPGEQSARLVKIATAFFPTAVSS
jgi:hypothetical protein